MARLEDMNDVADASALLDAAEAAEAAAIAPATTEAEPNPTQPGEPQGEPASPPDPLPSDTPAAAEPPKPAEPAAAKSEPKPGDAPDANPNASKFAKDKARRDESWKALNADKEKFATERKAFEAQQAELTRREEQFALKQSKATQRFTPEQYEQAGQNKLANADQLLIQAEGLEARAEKLDGEGKYAEAQSARAQAQDRRETAAAEKGLARQMKAMAEQVRKNPDPTVEQVKARNQQAMKHYTLEAAKQWPDLTKEGSEFQKQTAAHLNEAARNGIDPQEHPLMMFYAARLTAAETAAARVPAMTKELGELKAKVKDLEVLTAPGGGSPSASRIPEPREKSDDEEGVELRSMALQS